MNPNSNNETPAPLNNPDQNTPPQLPDQQPLAQPLQGSQANIIQPTVISPSGQTQTPAEQPVPIAATPLVMAPQVTETPLQPASPNYPTQPFVPSQPFQPLPANGRSKIKKLLIILIPAILLLAVTVGLILKFVVFNDKAAVSKTAQKFVTAVNKADLEGVKATSGLATNMSEEEQKQFGEINKFFTIEDDQQGVVASSSRGIVTYKGSVNVFGKQDINIAIFLGKIDGKWLVTFMDIQEKDKQFELDLTKYTDAHFSKDGFEKAEGSGAFGASSGSASEEVQEKADFTEVRTDINALHAQLEAYYADKGSYPSFSQINDPQFRAANLKGLDIEATKPPNSDESILVKEPKPNTYAYQPSPTDCTNSGQRLCTGYTLTGTHNSGVVVKSSLN